jgi:hypothetical protein
MKRNMANRLTRDVALTAYGAGFLEGWIAASGTVDKVALRILRSRCSRLRREDKPGIDPLVLARRWIMRERLNGK